MITRKSYGKYCERQTKSQRNLSNKKKIKAKKQYDNKTKKIQFKVDDKVLIMYDKTLRRGHSKLYGPDRTRLPKKISTFKIIQSKKEKKPHAYT